MVFGNTIFMNVYQSHGGVHQLSTARKVYAENNVIRRIAKRNHHFVINKAMGESVDRSGALSAQSEAQDCRELPI